MSETLPPKAQTSDTPLLPTGEAIERPLIIIMATMAFLASLTLMLTLMGFRTSHVWQTDLARTATVQIYMADSDTRESVIGQARIIVAQNLPGSEVEPLSQGEAQSLLRPWLGNLELPDDLPLPIMLRLTTNGENVLNPVALQAAFEEVGLETDVDDHARWGEGLLRTWRAVQIGMLMIIIIVISASMAVATFAAQSVLRARQNIIDVLQQVGASDRFIIRLFWTRFLGFGLKGAFVGALSALLFLFAFTALKGSLASGFLPALNLQISDLLWLGVLTVIMGVITGLTAGFAARSGLRRERRLM